jgi:hypothetical protein
MPGPPPAVDPALRKFMQIIGDKVLVEITVKDYNNDSRLQLESIGFKVNAVYGRVVSGMVPIACLPLFQSLSVIRFARPAFRTRIFQNPLVISDLRTLNFLLRYQNRLSARVIPRYVPTWPGKTTALLVKELR